MDGESERNIRFDEHVAVNGNENGNGHGNGSEHGTSQTTSVFEPLPQLHTPHKKRRTILWAGVALAVLDLCCLPITYFYALKFGTSLSLQEGNGSLCI